MVDVANEMRIQKITYEHFETLCLIYKQGIETGIATFQIEIPTWELWDKSHLTFGRIGIFDNENLVGWAALSPVSSRCIYKGVAEVSIYIHNEYKNKGIGKFLLNELIKESEENNIWTLQSLIFSENNASINLHIICGFRIIGIREKIGLKDGVWKDNIILEKRSKTIGI